LPLSSDLANCECLSAVDVQSLVRASGSFHRLTADVLAGTVARLVNAERQAVLVRANDPHRLMREGYRVDSAVEQAFSNGLFEISEIAFDDAHRHALVSYSHWCGLLCGSGGVLLFDRVDGVWKKSERICGGWVS
jgi:uncharacterized UPF0160 family protein